MRSNSSTFLKYKGWYVSYEAVNRWRQSSHPALDAEDILLDISVLSKENIVEKVLVKTSKHKKIRNQTIKNVEN